MLVNNYLKTEIKYALLSAIALVIWVSAEHLLGFNTTKMEIGQYTRPIIAIAAFVFLFFGIREKKNKEFNGQLTFMQGLKTAFFISLFYALLQGIWFAIYGQVINPDYAALSLQFKEKQLIAEGKTPQITDELAMTKMIFGNALLQFAFFIFSTTIVDTVAGAIMTLFLKTKKVKT
jgi:membrane protease YdiL (CAAX protease family)